MSEERFGFILNDTARLLRQRFDQCARALGVTRAQWRTLLMLSRAEGINQAKLAEHLEIENITLCRMIDRLQEAGWVERRPDQQDRRAWRLFLTETAKPLLDELWVIGDAVQKEAFAGLSASEIDTLNATLTRIRANLSNKSVDAPQRARA